MSLATASAEMYAVASQNARVKDPVYHVVLSWAPGENPTDEQAFQSAAYALRAVGMDDHQYVFAVHRDTDNVHVHIAVNRVNPNTFRTVYPERDYYKLDYAMRELELANNWQRVDGVYSIFERNGVATIDWTSAKPDSKGKQPSRAADMERHDGVESLFTFARGEPRRAIATLLKRDDISWQTIHWQLAEFGLEIRPKGQGLAIYSQRDPDVTPIKASDLHENMSLKRITTRIGEYENARAHSVAPKATYDRHRPLKRDPVQREQQRQVRAELRKDLRIRYQQYRTGFVAPRVDIRAELAAISADARLKRTNIKNSSASPAAKRAMYSVLAFETMRERERLKADAAGRRIKLRADGSLRPLAFRQWVDDQAAKGDAAAISQVRGWAYAEKRKAQLLVDVVSNESADGLQSAVDHDPQAIATLPVASQFRVRRDGTVFYHDRAGLDLFVDRGRAIQMIPDRSATKEYVADALRLAAEKFNGGFRLTGSEAFKRFAIEVMLEERISATLLDDQQAQLKETMSLHSKTSKSGRAAERKK